MDGGVASADAATSATANGSTGTTDAGALDAGLSLPDGGTTTGTTTPAPQHHGVESDASGHPHEGSPAEMAVGATPAAVVPEQGQSGEVRIRYFLERVEVHGNTGTDGDVIRRFVPLHPGDVLDVDDPDIEAIRWRLLGTGWFRDVRLRLRRGSRRGWVVLVVEVEERNTLVVTQLALGVTEGVRSTTDHTADLLPYAGLGLAETNLLGTGIELAGTGLLSKRQQGIRLRFSDPAALGAAYLLSAGAFFNNAEEFFGHDPLVSIVCPPPDPTDPTARCPPEIEARNAVVFYRRYGLSLGMGHDLGPSTRYTLTWQGELVDVPVKPDAASEARGAVVRPIDFSINNGISFVSSIKLGLIYDRRDDPALPTRGTLIDFRGDAGTRLLGSDYDFLRLQALFRKWIPLPWGSGQSLRFGAFGGVVFGRAPFFYKFYVSDLSDLIPSRVLEMNLDRRPPPNLLGTSIEVMRSEEIAGRIDVEYGLRLFTGTGGLRAINAYAEVGLYALADFHDLRVAIPGYVGLSRIPVDMTFDLGIKADTDIGLFQLGFSNLLGFITP